MHSLTITGSTCPYSRIKNGHPLCASRSPVPNKLPYKSFKICNTLVIKVYAMQDKDEHHRDSSLVAGVLVQWQTLPTSHAAFVDRKQGHTSCLFIVLPWATPLWVTLLRMIFMVRHRLTAGFRRYTSWMPCHLIELPWSYNDNSILPYRQCLEPCVCTPRNCP